MNIEKKFMTTSTGAPVSNNQDSLTAGKGGPLLLSDLHLIDKLAKFDRERIPERVVHAKGAGAYGYLEITNDVSQYTKAQFLNNIGQKTPLFTRFSTTLGENGSSDTDRDPRGWAIKFYTQEGICDFVMNNTPFFFIRDPIKFPDVIHSRKRNPKTGLRDPNMSWDFISLTPESMQAIMFLFSERGISDGYRHMNGFSAHAFKWVNAQGESYFVKYHFKTDVGIKNLLPSQVKEIEAITKDYNTRDLYQWIDNGNEATWKFYIQVMPEKDAVSYRYDVTDITKIWPYSDYPLIQVGKLVLNKNPLNYFSEVEQVAFSPGNLVPGIELSNDRILQARVFSYPDTQRHRLGPNFDQIPINCPFNGIHNGIRDGIMNMKKDETVNYEPNSLQDQGYIEDKSKEIQKYSVQGFVQRLPFDKNDIDFEQPRVFWSKVFTEWQKQHLVDNMSQNMESCRNDIKQRMIGLCNRIHPEFGQRLEDALQKLEQKQKI